MEKEIEIPDFERDAIIDETALDYEWIQQPSLAKKYAKYLAYCSALLRQANEKVKTVRSELSMEAMTDPKKAFGKEMGAVSDTKCEIYYSTHPKYQKVKKKYNKLLELQEDAEYAYKEIAFTRKTELENLVKLNGQNYFSAPSVPRDLHKVVEEKKKDSNINIKRKKSKKQ